MAEDTTPNPKRKPGRPAQDKPEGLTCKYDGNPHLSLRLDKKLWEYVYRQPEGPRVYIRRLIVEDMEEYLDPSIDPILLKQAFKTEGGIK